MPSLVKGGDVIEDDRGIHQKKKYSTLNLFLKQKGCDYKYERV